MLFKKPFDGFKRKSKALHLRILIMGAGESVQVPEETEDQRHARITQEYFDKVQQKEEYSNKIRKLEAQVTAKVSDC